MSSFPVGVFIATATEPERIPKLAQHAEQLGYGELWVAEDYFCYGGFTASTLALQATSNISVGLGVAASVARHPAVTAMEIASVARAFPGRFRPGIGHGLPIWTDQMGLTPKSPLTTLTECVTSVRSLLAGETRDEEGKHFAFHSIELRHPPIDDVPVLTGVIGPKSLKLSGKIADGTVVSVVSGTKYLELAMEQIREGMAEGGRTSHLLPTLTLFSINRDSKAAKEAVRPSLAFYLAAIGPHSPLTSAFGYSEHLTELLARGGADAVARDMPAEWVDELTVAGDPDEVAERIKRLLAAGATSVVLSPVTAETALEELELCSQTVLPSVGA